MPDDIINQTFEQPNRLFLKIQASFECQVFSLGSKKINLIVEHACRRGLSKTSALTRGLEDGRRQTRRAVAFIASTNVGSS